jgi:hypothetical protein
VAQQAERRPGTLAPKSRDQVRSARLGREELALEAGVGQRLRQKLLRGLLVAGRVDGVDPQQPAQ